MNTHRSSTEPFSFSGLSTRNFRQIYAHKLQWFRWVLSLVIAFHLTPNGGKLYWHYNTHHTPSILPDFLSFSLSVAARVTWLFLFRDPASFLHFRRPRRSYRWAVCGTILLTTLPNFVVHIWALNMALENDTFILAGVWAAIMAILFLVPLVGLVWWMAWMFLLGFDESDEEFEPTVKDRFVIAGEDRYTTPIIMPYTDNVSASARGTEIIEDCLDQAYKQQRLTEPERVADQTSAELGQISPSGEVQTEAVEIWEFHSTESTSTDAIEIAAPLRCQTIARFEHMSQSHSGPHSWFSYPIIPLILSTYGTILLIGLPIWIHEDREYRFRDPSPTIKKSLYQPLGLYMLSFYALKHRVRESLFEHFDIPPPEPWKRMLSILPSWFGTGGTFKNRDTGEITVYDPGRRAFPWRAYHQHGLIRNPEYLATYNKNPGTCTTVWGHLGRKMKTDMRFRATMHRIGFILLAMYFVWKGFWNTLHYDVPNIYEEMLKHPKNLTKEDVSRIFRIVKLWQAFVFSGLWFVILAVVFAVGSVGSMLVLFVRVVWKYVPQEEKDQIMRDQLEREREQRGDGEHDNLG